ncbi:Deoxyribonuclease Tat-D [Curvularia clavata]|uniref:Deoxyribonuclease Tat-D n=1 Tax=Curvularia clavata TaxID=95742 RepID=A0A9Q8ZAD6_CURCL|nr:Deoxyribonuclease Tat-D [Curvularia clavata]
MSSSPLLDGFPNKAPPTPVGKVRYADVAVTATAKEFAGYYRGKQYHEPDFDAVLDRALAAGVEKVMLTGMYAADVPINTEVACKHPEQCRITIGIHPYHALEADEGGEEYYESLSRSISQTMDQTPQVLSAFGELGLDYDKLVACPKEVQIRVFKRQLDMIVDAGWKLPLFLHCRAAFEDFVSILEPYWNRLPLQAGLVHSFVGTTEQMEKLTSMGLHVSVNNFAFRDRDSLEMIRQIPLEKLQIETDAPWGEIQASSEVAKAYLQNATKWPWGNKKKDKFSLGDLVKERNESCSIEKVALVVAGLKGLSVDEVANSAWNNSVRMFFSKRADASV